MLILSSDVLIAIPLFVFMGYLVERANLIEKLFKSLHLAMARIPGSLAVATLVTWAIFATTTGIVGAVVTLMGLLVALNLQTAFLSPPAAIAAFYLKGVSPPHVTPNQIFAGMLPFMGLQVLAIVLPYQLPGIGSWLPQLLYK